MRTRLLLLVLLLLNIIAVAVNISFGSVPIPFVELFDERWHYIIWQSRMPASITAAFTGASLGATGLLLQSYFRNPLAGPSILGITSGANLMIALVTIGGLSLSFSLAWLQGISVVAALLGAFAVLALLLALSKIVPNQTTLLIVGMLLSYLTSALITLIGYRATAQGVQSLMIWGMGDFGGVGFRTLPLYIGLTGAGLIATLWLIKPMNGWMQGEYYARNLGIDLSRTRMLLLSVTGFLAAITTAWCGPIAFVGIAMPHVARMIFRTDNHLLLLPASMLSGALCCSLCLWLSTLPEGGTLLPINALTPLFGVPVILHVLLKK